MSDETTISAFDRLIGMLHGLPDVTESRPSTVRTMSPLIGASQTFIVQTFRQRDVGDTIFVESISAEGQLRFAIPPKVAEAIARQREILTTKSRSKAAKQVAAERAERGEKPAFMKGRKS